MPQRNHKTHRLNPIARVWALSLLATPVAFAQQEEVAETKKPPCLLDPGRSIVTGATGRGQTKLELLP